MIGASPSILHKARGDLAGIVFQEPMTSLNPLHRIGRQVAEAITLHRQLSRAALLQRVVGVLDEAGFPDAEHRLDAFPHQLSGGQRQRVMIAMALANDPALLIADEPTTALDVTIQARILALLARLKTSRGLALLLITHDLRIVRRYADRVCVMKDGAIVEERSGSVGWFSVFAAPAHPYTRMLLDARSRAALPHAAGGGGAPPLLRIEIRKGAIFPIRRGVHCVVVGRGRSCRRWRFVDRARGRNGWPGWRVRIGQNDARSGGVAIGTGGGARPVRRTGRRSTSPHGGDAGVARADADRVSGPLRQPVAPNDGQRHQSRKGLG